jgi:hypothetical protein
MSQILVCTIYLQAAITKIRSPLFASGDLLTFSLLDDHWGAGHFDFGSWLATVPHAAMLLSLGIVLFELLFPFLVWARRCRLPMLALAVLIHTGMAFALQLKTFTPTMYVALLAFVDERDWRRGKLFGAWDPAASRGNAGRRQISRIAFVAAGLLVVGTGLAIQYFADWYGAFGRRTFPPLAEVSAADFAEMRAARLPAYGDYFHQIEVGTRVSGNQLFGASRHFRRGQRAYLLAHLMQPHPTIVFEGLLIDPSGQEVARFAHRIDSGYAYAVNGFELTDELTPGPYRIILQVDGYEIGERRFELVP